MLLEYHKRINNCRCFKEENGSVELKFPLAIVLNETRSSLRFFRVLSADEAESSLMSLFGLSSKR